MENDTPKALGALQVDETKLMLRRLAKSVRVCSAKLGRVSYWIAHTIPRKLELPSCGYIQWNVSAFKQREDISLQSA